MKKIVFVLPLMLAALSCFAEIRVDRGGYMDERVRSTNVAVYWNDKYTSLTKSAQQLAKETFSDLTKNEVFNKTFINGTVHMYHTLDGLYLVEFTSDIYGQFYVNALYGSLNNNYLRQLSSDIFYSLNDANAQFDYLCKKYYNEIPK